MSYPDLSAHSQGQSVNTNIDKKSHATDGELGKKRTRRLESIANWPSSNPPMHVSGNPIVSEDVPKKSVEATLVADIVETEGESTMEQIRRRQAGQQSDAGTELYRDGDIFRGRPLLTLKKKADQKF